MAFQNLRNSNQLFILHKDSVPTLEIGKVTNVSVPVPKYGNPGMYNQEMIVDITADINGTSAISRNYLRWETLRISEIILWFPATKKQ